MLPKCCQTFRLRSVKSKRQPWPQIRKTSNHGKAVYLCDARVKGRGQRRFFDNRQEAEGWAQQQRVKRQNDGGKAFDDRELDFTEANLGTYSTELARLYLSICPEIDVVAKQLTKKINPEAKAWDIKDYRSVIPARYEHFCEFPVAVPRLGSSLTPWKEWQTDQNPPWWQSYNNVKHHRDTHYAEANLGNVLHSACGLFVLTFYFYQEAFQAHKIDPGPMRAPAWDRSLGSTLWFAPDYRVPDLPGMK